MNSHIGDANKMVAARESEMVVIKRGEDGSPAIWCDPEIADLVSALNVTGITTVASCSGHGHRPGTIALADGRELLVMPNSDAARKIDYLWPGINGEPAALQDAAFYVNKWELERGAADGVVAMRAGKHDPQRGFFTVPLFLAAPVAAAPAEVERAQVNLDAGWYARREQQAQSLGYAGVGEALEALESMSTPAAPGIDLREIAEALAEAEKYVEVLDSMIPRSSVRACLTRIRAAISLIDASPKGGSEPVVTLTIGEAGEEGTQAYFLDRVRDTEAFGKLQPGTYQLAVCSIQATSAEVGA